MSSSLRQTFSLAIISSDTRKPWVSHSRKQFFGAGEIVRQYRAVHVQHAAGGLSFIDHKTAADRIVRVAMQLTALAFGDQGHGIGVERQVFVDQQHVPRPLERDRQVAVEQQGVGFFAGWRCCKPMVEGSI